MSDESMADDRIITECDLDAAPGKVWRALTEPHLVKAWLVPDDVDCRVMEAQPGQLLRCSWRSRRDERDDEGNSLDTVVTFELSETQAGGTHLRIVHEGFAMVAPAANDNGEIMMMRAA
ncbi:SRPBCC family protein [Taklimakanibacter lacteus]|uniref:SRPBCC family protein n=1 Tax=Taklimakanibacter lacteus TaxID=2268456 RepID=UPI000E6757E4